MKILKIRENKLKLSLSSEEASVYGFSRHVQSPSDLRAAVERIFADRRELFRIEEKIIVEAYPKIDGSCDVFVTNLSGHEEKGQDASRRAALWGFASAEHLALALYVLLCERERLGAAPLCEREEGEAVQCQNELCEKENARPLSECCGGEAFSLGDLVVYLKEKTGNDRIEKLREALRGAHIYEGERMAHEGVCAYVLAFTEQAAEAQSISPMYEFATPIAHLDAEVLAEHATELSIDALIGKRE